MPRWLETYVLPAALFAAALTFFGFAFCLWRSACPQDEPVDRFSQALQEYDVLRHSGGYSAIVGCCVGGCVCVLVGLFMIIMGKKHNINEEVNPH